jgi:ribosomal protein S8
MSDLLDSILRRFLEKRISVWLKSICNAKKRQASIRIRPSSKVIVVFLIITLKHGQSSSIPGADLIRLSMSVRRLFIGEFEIVDDHRSG